MTAALIVLLSAVVLVDVVVFFILPIWTKHKRAELSRQLRYWEWLDARRKEQEAMRKLNRELADDWTRAFFRAGGAVDDLMDGGLARPPSHLEREAKPMRYTR